MSVLKPLLLSCVLAAIAQLAAAADSLESIADDVVVKHMQEKRIPGLSLSIVADGRLCLSKGYGVASIEHDVAATAKTIYPISSVSKIFAGLVAVRLQEIGALDLDASISAYLDGVPDDKHAVTVRHLLQHTHGLDDFYRSGEYSRETGKTVSESSPDELIRWSLSRPLLARPGDVWSYSLAGYVVLARLLEAAGGSSYPVLVSMHVLEPLDMHASFGSSDIVIPGRNSVMYELIDGTVRGHVVDFPEFVWAAGGMNISATELSKLFAALQGEEFISAASKAELWRNISLPGESQSNYGLGWFSYRTSQDRQVVGHEGGGASWVIYYPDTDLAIIALSNMSGARADSLPYEIARAAFASGLFPDPREISPATRAAPQQTCDSGSNDS
jgi:CubicO group peptidase (beta-lactamase class C family)